jgi:hypothetical protein
MVSKMSGTGTSGRSQDAGFSIDTFWGAADVADVADMMLGSFFETKNENKMLIDVFFLSGCSRKKRQNVRARLACS